jgi:hypothetical protein
VRTDYHQVSPIAGDSAQAEAMKVVTRARKTLVWERTPTWCGCAGLPDFFPTVLAAFTDLTAADALKLLAMAPDPAAAGGWASGRSARHCVGPPT